MKKIKFYNLYSKKKGPKQKFLPNKIDKWYIFCYEAIEKMYLDGISAFSQHVALRINYIIFLTKVIRNKSKALTEINDTCNLKCSC